MTTETLAARAVMDPAEPLVNRNAPAPHAMAREALSWNLLHPIRKLLRPRIEGDLLGNNACFCLLFVGLRHRTRRPGLGRYIVSTARKRALPSTTRWYAFGASANG